MAVENSMIAAQRARRVVEREHPAPGLAEDAVAPGDPEVLGERGVLVLEELDRPERRVGVGQVVAAPRCRAGRRARTPVPSG
jgi:hypothetical protein